MIWSDVREAAAIWRQAAIPAVYRPGGAPLLVKLPHASDNLGWLRNGKRTAPVWRARFKSWEVPRAWFNDVIRRALQRYQRVYAIQPFREQEKCAPACWNASGFDCECSCMGEHHGEQGGGAGWFVVSETCAVRHGERVLGCRLIEAQSR